MAYLTVQRDALGTERDETGLWYVMDVQVTDSDVLPDLNCFVLRKTYTVYGSKIVFHKVCTPADYYDLTTSEPAGSGLYRSDSVQFLLEDLTLCRQVWFLLQEDLRNLLDQWVKLYG